MRDNRSFYLEIGPTDSSQISCVFDGKNWCKSFQYPLSPNSPFCYSLCIKNVNRWSAFATDSYTMHRFPIDGSKKKIEPFQLA